MDLSPRAKLGILYCLSILVPSMLTGISLLLHKPTAVAGWMWVPAGVFTAILGLGPVIDFVKGIPSLVQRIWSSSVVTKIRVGSRTKIFWAMASLYLLGILSLALPSEKKPVWSLVCGIGATAGFAIYQIRMVYLNEKQVEARFRRFPIARATPPTPEVSTPPSQWSGIARTGRVVLHIEGRPDIELPSVTLPQPTIELLPDPEPDTRLTRILKDDYPL